MRRNLLTGTDQFDALRQRVQRRPFDAFYNTLHKRCSLILETAPVTERQWRMLSQQGSPTAATEAARTAQGRLMDLTVAYHIDDNSAFCSRAIEELKDLISWTAWIEPGNEETGADLCTAEAAVAAAVGLDWLWDHLPEADRQRVQKAIREKAVAPYLAAVQREAWWNNCYHHANAVVNGGCGLAALALSDEDDTAGRAHRAAKTGLKRFFDAFGREGGWDEGPAFWGYALRYVLLLGQAESNCLDDQSIFHARGMDATGAFAVYFGPHGQSAGFARTHSVPLLGALYLLTQYHDQKDLVWWLDTYSFHHDVSTTGYSAAALALLFRPEKLKTPKSPKLAPVKVFGDVGWAAMADAWPHPRLYAGMHCGDLAANNSRRDMNAVEVQVDGEMILSSAHYAADAMVRSDNEHRAAPLTSAANTLVVGRRDHRLDAQGSIVAAKSGKDYRYLAGDGGIAIATPARWRRHMVMAVGDGGAPLLLVLDDLDNPISQTMDLFWHTLGSVEMDGGDCGRFVGGKSELAFAVATTCPVAIVARRNRRGRRKRGSLLHVFSEGTDRALLAVAFSPGGPVGGVNIAYTADGANVTAGDVTFHFKEKEGQLVFSKLTR